MFIFYFFQSLWLRNSVIMEICNPEMDVFLPLVKYLSYLSVFLYEGNTEGHWHLITKHQIMSMYISMFLLATPHAILILWKWPKYATTPCFIPSIFMSISSSKFKYWHIKNNRLYSKKNEWLIPYGCKKWVYYTMTIMFVFHPIKFGEARNNTCHDMNALTFTAKVFLRL